MLCGMLATAVLVNGAATYKVHAHVPSSAQNAAATGLHHSFIDGNASLMPTDASTPPTYSPPNYVAADRAQGVQAVAESPYFRATTRLYDSSTHTEASTPAEPMPMDEIARFHQLDTRMPVTPTRISSPYGHRHNPLGKGEVFHQGIDMAAPIGTPVHAVAEGTVVKARKEKDYGNVVEINHHNGFHTLYAHNSKLLVKAGDRVQAGQQIAKVGSTGRSTGSHLHFEIHRDGECVDPSPYLAEIDPRPFHHS
jgi:murein DD-endopeptidase MepM/ murein hydrolase activator NlpD